MKLIPIPRHFNPFVGGAYRHFMWIMAREVQSSHLGLLIPCPSAAANRNKVYYKITDYNSIPDK